MRLILCGGGSGNQNYYANKKLNEIIDHDKPLLYIPLAMDENDHPYDSCYEWIKEEMSQVKLPGIDMVRSFDELIQKDYQNYCALFIGGGNTYKLLKGIKESGAFLKIKEFINNDGIVIGGSAGAVIFGYDIDIIASMDSNDVELTDTKGFDVMNGISIFPHYTNKKSKLTEEENLARLNNFTNAISSFALTRGDVLAIPEEDAIFVNNNRLEILGNRPFYYFENSKMQKFVLEQNPTFAFKFKYLSCDNNIEIIEYNEKYLEDVRDLLVELEEYIISIDKDDLDQLHPEYREKMAILDLQEVNNYNGKCYLAIENDKAIGLIMGCIPPYDEYDYLDYKCPKRGEITELIVTNKTRSKGLGQMLINKMEEYFESLGCEYAMVDVFTYNKKGMSFYNKKGYHSRMNTLIKKID